MVAKLIGNARFRWCLALAIVIPYLSSLWLPVVFTEGYGAGTPGWVFAAYGSLGVFQAQWGWFANFGVVMAIGMLRAGRHIPWYVVTLCAIPVVLCEIDALNWTQILRYNTSLPTAIVAYGWGYWLWIGSVTMSLAAMALMIGPRKAFTPPASR